MSTLVEQAIAALNRDPAAIRDAARGIQASARPVADQGAQVARTWRGCDPFYVAPESAVLVAALDPVVVDTQATSDRLDSAGKLLGRYADRIEPLLAQAKAIVSFVGPVDPAAAAQREQRLNGILAELSALDLELAGALKGLTGNTSFNPVPGRVKIGEASTKTTDELTLGVIKIGQNLAVVETQFSDGRVMFTLTDGGKVGATLGLGETAEVGKAGLTGKLELAPGISFENGSSWLVPGDQAESFRQQFLMYAYRQAASVSPDESIAQGAFAAEALHPLPPLPPPDSVVTNFEVPVELKGKLDASVPGVVDVTATGSAGLTPKWGEVRLKDGSVVTSFGGEGSVGGDVKVGRDDTDPVFGGNADGKSVGAGAVAVTRDPTGHISRVVLTSSEEAQSGLSDKAGPGLAEDGVGPKASATGTQKSSTVDVTTASLAVDDSNRAIVEQWVAQHERDPGVALGSKSTFYPAIAEAHDPFQNVLHTDAQVSKVRYENVTDKLGVAAEASLGVSVGTDVGAETTQSHAVGGSYLDTPGIDGQRPEKPLPRVGG